MIRAVIGSKFRILIKFLKARKGGWGRPQNSSPSHNQSFVPFQPRVTKGSSDMGRDMGNGYRGPVHLPGMEVWGGVDWVSTGLGVGFVPNGKPPVEKAFEFPCGCRKWVGGFLACTGHEGKELMVPAYPVKGDCVRELKGIKDRRHKEHCQDGKARNGRSGRNTPGLIWL